ncbi:MAG TPA: hypothetical protein VHL59_14950 [Thermoanaerobaculia bacterium]|nr:hypothetical protein [Thermoanaerobaculia bacterium]
MRSKVAEALRRETEEEMLAMSPDERLALAFRLGEEAIETFAAARGISREEAKRLLAAERRRGRRYSRCIEELNGDVAP